MHTFKDKNGTEWEIDLTIGLVEYIKEKLDIDLLEPVSSESSVAVQLCPVDADGIRKFTNLLVVICTDQFAKANISPGGFKMLLGSESLREANEAFFKEWMLFFQSLGRLDLCEAIIKIRNFVEEGIEELTEKIKDATSPVGNSSTNLQE